MVIINKDTEIKNLEIERQYWKGRAIKAETELHNLKMGLRRNAEELNQITDWLLDSCREV